MPLAAEGMEGSTRRRHGHPAGPQPCPCPAARQREARAPVVHNSVTTAAGFVSDRRLGRRCRGLGTEGRVVEVDELRVEGGAHHRAGDGRGVDGHLHGQECVAEKCDAQARAHRRPGVACRLHLEQARGDLPKRGGLPLVASDASAVARRGSRLNGDVDLCGCGQRCVEGPGVARREGIPPAVGVGNVGRRPSPRGVPCCGWLRTSA